MSTPSTLVADRYRLVKMLGAGGMGVVWQAWDERLRRPVALKLLRTQPELSDLERDQATERAMREARITAGLHHPHAVTVFDVVEHEGRPCIVMQLIESTPLSRLLSEHGTLTPPETARIGAQVASALAAAHKMRIVHRDVKPGNILITGDGSAMISDFGISHALGDSTITATGMIHGTPAYLAPEVARGLPTSFASDVFSLGSTLYAMLEGAPPFGTEKNAIALLHKVARGGYPAPKNAGPLTPVLRSMLAAEPKRRPTMAAVVESLSASAEKSPPAAPPPPGELPWPFDALAGAGVAGVTTEPLPDAAPPAAALAAGPPTAATLATDTAAATPPTLPAPHTPRPTAETIRADVPTRHESPTAETEPLDGGGPRPPVPAGPTPPVPEPTNRGRRAAAVVGILALLGVVVVSALLLWNPLRSDLDGAAEPRSTRSAPPATEPSSAAPTPSASATTVSPVEPAPPPAEPAPPSPEQRVAETLTGYYAMLPSDLDGAWPLMTADYQENHAGGRGGYEAFWGAIEDVEIAEVTAPAPDQAQATLTYYYRDGGVIQEVTVFQLVDEGGVLKIAATDVLSSAQL
ncbi:MAG TPA: serine/threonine-protein kinase [Microbacterium sp.]|nr:serine/threonine-protein kinase [Microbacterium sp.]